jgi:hypothetical protein
MPNSARSESKLEQSKEFLRVYAMLIRAAQQRGFVTEDDVADLMGLSTEERAATRATARMLEAIAQREARSGRPILSAVVVTSATHTPVRSFQRSASERGLLPVKVSKEQRDRVWRAELQRLFEEWAD